MSSLSGVMNEGLREEHKLVRSAARDWVKRDVSPIIEYYAQRAEFPTQIIGGLAVVENGSTSNKSKGSL